MTLQRNAESDHEQLLMLQSGKSTLSKDLEPYLLRHTFCTDCQAAGVPINVAKELMGHSDISVTAKIYTHMVDEVFEQNRQRLAEFTANKFITT